jgi:hypothetical protein
MDQGRGSSIGIDLPHWHLRLIYARDSPQSGQSLSDGQHHLDQVAGFPAAERYGGSEPRSRVQTIPPKVGKPRPSRRVLTGTTTTAAVAGVATFSDLSLTATGAYTLTATDGIDSSATSTSFTVSSPTAYKMKVATEGRRS